MVAIRRRTSRRPSSPSPYQAGWARVAAAIASSSWSGVASGQSPMTLPVFGLRTAKVGPPVTMRPSMRCPSSVRTVSVLVIRLLTSSQFVEQIEADVDPPGAFRPAVAQGGRGLGHGFDRLDSIFGDVVQA